MTRQQRVLRLLLRLYPRSFRDRYEAEMIRLFGEQARDAELSGGWLSLSSLWARSVLDIVVTAPGHHLEQEALVPQPIDARPISSPPSNRLGRPRAAWTAVALLPAWLQLLVWVVSPGYFDPMLEYPPGIAGAPAGVVLGGFAVLLTIAGVLVVRRTTSTLALFLSLALLTIPAAVIIVLGPAIILLIQNLG